MNKSNNFASLGDILSTYTKNEEDKYISHEFQQYGYDLAVELQDLKHKALYIKMAKEESRGLLEAARSYVKDAFEVENKGKLFMWKLSQLRKLHRNKATEKQSNI